MKRSTKTQISAGTLAILVALNGFVTGLKQSRNGNCELFVDYAHESKYTRNNNMGDYLKIDARTECTRNQKYSEVSMTIYEVKGSATRALLEIPAEKVYADVKNPKIAYFNNFKSACVGHHPIKYFGVALVEVKLVNGKIKKVTGKSKKSIYVDCVTNAK